MSRAYSMKELINAYRIVVEKPERRNHLGVLDLYKRIILKWILKKEYMRHGLDSSCSG
jgi:hypothetical protein